MELLYTIDPSANEPIMLIDTHIGEDDNKKEGIMGDKFSRELMFLDTLGKSRIQVWINSGGGSVIDAQQIYATILKTKTKVDTYNLGIAASSAGFIFQAGRKRYMLDSATLMMHDPYGGDKKSLDAFKDCIVKMLSRHPNIDEQNISDLMKKETWLNASECLSMGLCDEIENLSDYNKPRVTKEEGVESALNKYALVLNKLIENKKPKKMIKVANKLNLNPDASEDSIVTAIAEVQNKADRLDKFMDDFNKMKKEKEESENRYNEMKSKFDKFMDEAENAKKEEAKNKTRLEIKNLVTEGAKVGKIENKVEVIDAFVAKVENLKVEDVKSMLDAIPSKVTGADLGSTKGTPKTYTVQDINNELENKNKIK